MANSQDGKLTNGTSKPTVAQPRPQTSNAGSSIWVNVNNSTSVSAQRNAMEKSNDFSRISLKESKFSKRNPK